MDQVEVWVMPSYSYQNSGTCTTHSPERGWGESSKEEELSESGVELRLECRIRCLGWVEGVENCPIFNAKVKSDKVVHPVVPGAAVGRYRVWVLIGIAGKEVS